MKSYNSNSNSAAVNAAGGGGISFAGVLQIVFIVLKLCHVIDWPWFWVLFPTVLSVGILLLALLILVGAVIVMKIIEIKETREFDKKQAEAQKQREEKQRKIKEQLQTKTYSAPLNVFYEGVSDTVRKAYQGFIKSLNLASQRYAYFPITTKRDYNLSDLSDYGRIEESELRALNSWIKGTLDIYNITDHGYIVEERQDPYDKYDQRNVRYFLVRFDYNNPLRVAVTSTGPQENVQVTYKRLEYDITELILPCNEIEQMSALFILSMEYGDLEIVNFAQRHFH